MYTHDTPDKEALQRVCELLGEAKTLTEICEMPLMPPWNTLHEWMRHQWVRDAIARAREIGSYRRDDETEKLFAKEPKTMVEVQWRKIKAEYLERKNARFNPEVFGERRALPGSAQPPALPNPEAAKLEDDKMAASLKQLEEKLAGMAKVSKGGPRMLNVTPMRKPDIDGKAVRK